jgi:Endonuclease/Exonuclease/phosphatase family
MLQTCVKLILALAIGSCCMANDVEPRGDSSIRFATFNIQELSLQKLKPVNSDRNGAHPQVTNCAEILQTVRPDIVLINEIDAPSTSEDGDIVNPAGNAAQLFRDKFLMVSQRTNRPLDFPYVYIAPSNTGVPTGHDLDNDGKTDGPADSYGFGRYPGEYGMALLSRFPIQMDGIRTFRKLLWKNMPGNLMPDGTQGKPAFYNADECNLFRLSSKSHWDVPLLINETVVHVLCSHPTPPVFDGPEDSNGRRNFDEIRFWSDYLTGGESAMWICDDAGKSGGLKPGSHFVVLGDLNAEPVRGDAVYGQRAINLLIHHRLVFDPEPRSRGAEEQPNKFSLNGYLPLKTSDFGRLDYVLPSKSLRTVGSGVFWPSSKSPLYFLVDTPQSSSDHRLVWLDVEIP